MPMLKRGCVICGQQVASEPMPRLEEGWREWPVSRRREKPLTDSNRRPPPCHSASEDECDTAAPAQRRDVSKSFRGSARILRTGPAKESADLQEKKTGSRRAG